ncbi:helix-turn-helix transcriptional regulator [Amycolatopsis sp. NPDC051102]|uniref:helix-turn-helix domain-containing protein n=1 Tax=Amycolatopsis sp. NPDC051102 TaxID=3155163 RepID=UPI003448666D
MIVVNSTVSKTKHPVYKFTQGEVMKASEKPLPSTLGQYLEQGRQQAGLSHRQLASASGVHESTVNRLLKDQIEKPSAEQVQQLARVLELSIVDALAYIGVVRPRGLPSTKLYLREKFGLRGEQLDEATQEIQEIIDRHNN